VTPAADGTEKTLAGVDVGVGEAVGVPVGVSEGVEDSEGGGANDAQPSATLPPEPAAPTAPPGAPVEYEGAGACEELTQLLPPPPGVPW
jgi:hypothetical protein